MTEPASPQSTKSGPLAGIRILDLTAVILGPYATMLLGDMGADVIKVESPGENGGDIMRWAGTNPEAAGPGMGPLYMMFNKNKRSVALDLKRPEDQAACAALARTCDVVCSNMRMDTAARLKMDYESLKAEVPNLVYVHAAGFGSDGPYAGRPAYDDLIQGISGGADILPRVDGNTAPRYLPTLAADKTVGLFMVQAVLAALFHKQRTGEGQLVEVPMFECYTHYVMHENLYGHVYDPPPAGTGFGYGRIHNPDRRPYKSKDGWIGILPYSDKNWADFFTLAGRPELNVDPRFSTYPARMTNIKTLYSMMDDMVSTRTNADWAKVLGEKSIPFAPINRFEDLVKDPHLVEVEFFRKQAHPDGYVWVDMKHPITYSASPASTRLAPPKLGQDTAEVLKEAGISLPRAAE
jgi:crotonobetainyl-CoA:carnitine CoA-transferase CaiB-like acyl-CoA transferase